VLRPGRLTPVCDTVPNECTTPKLTITSRKSRNTTSKTTGLAWNSSRRRSERSGRCRGCANKGAMPSVRRTRARPGCCKLTIRRGNGAGMEKWRVRGQARQVVEVVDVGGWGGDDFVLGSIP